MSKPFYLTTTLPYVNADLHMGHALEFVRADIIARYHKKMGDDVFFNTGTDEHGMKIYEKAQSLGKNPQQFVDESFESFKKSVEIFGLSPDIHYIRTTDPAHEKAAQEFWKRCYDNGYIYKKNYNALYCVGCESIKTDSELVNGECPDHPGRPLESIAEENYFFRYSAFTEKLTTLYESRTDFVVPDFRFNEIKAFVTRGLEDFSISRLKEKMPWGIPVPGDDNHVMYVWFDALTNYISTLGWPKTHVNMRSAELSSEDESFRPNEEDLFEKYWMGGTPTQYCGKDNLRFQSAMWQAMLMAAGVSHSYQIVINGFITGEGGVKMSKTLGNVVDPKDIVGEYSTDALRLFLAKEVSNFEDSSFSTPRFKETYNANLANGLGNLLSRTLTMAVSAGGTLSRSLPVTMPYEIHGFSMTAEVEGMTIQHYIDTVVLPGYKKALDSFEISTATDHVWSLVSFLDRVIARTEPFKLIKTDKAKAEAILFDLLSGLYTIADLIEPIMPTTAESMYEHLGRYDSNRPEVFTVKKFESPLFPRKV